MDGMRFHFKNFNIRNIGFYDLTEDQISLFRKRTREDDNHGEEEVTNQKKWKYSKTEDEPQNIQTFKNLFLSKEALEKNSEKKGSSRVMRR